MVHSFCNLSNNVDLIRGLFFSFSEVVLITRFEGRSAFLQNLKVTVRLHKQSAVQCAFVSNKAEAPVVK